MIKQILFDCGGVFATLNFESLMTEVTADPALGKLWAEKLWLPDSPWLQYDRGLYKIEEMPALLHEYLPEFSEEVIKKFLPLWPRRMPTIEGMETIVAELHDAGYPCYILSNWNEQFEDFRLHHPAIHAIDQEIISYKINMLKPDREIFDYAAEALGIDPAETLFVDDSPKNAESAIAAGYHAHRFTDAESFRRLLRELKILSS